MSESALGCAMLAGLGWGQTHASRASACWPFGRLDGVGRAREERGRRRAAPQDAWRHASPGSSGKVWSGRLDAGRRTVADCQVALVRAPSKGWDAGPRSEQSQDRSTEARARATPARGTHCCSCCSFCSAAVLQCFRRSASDRLAYWRLRPIPRPHPTPSHTHRSVSRGCIGPPRPPPSGSWPTQTLNGVATETRSAGPPRPPRGIIFRSTQMSMHTDMSH